MAKLKSLFQWFVLILLAYGLAEATAWVCLLVLARFQIRYAPIPAEDLFPSDKLTIQAIIQSEPTYLAFDANLGWSIRPKTRSADGLAQSNAQGFRADREYSSRAPSGMIRIAAFGDSFTHGDGVANRQTWEQKLSELNSRYEVLNFGVPGYSMDQGFLRFRQQGRLYSPNIVLIGISSEYIDTVVNTLRAFYAPSSGLPFSKPYYLFRNGQIVLQPNPLLSLYDYQQLLIHPTEKVPSLGGKDYWYQIRPHESGWDASPVVRLSKISLFLLKRRGLPSSLLSASGVYREGTDALRISEEILDQFYQLAETEGRTAVVVLFPSRRDIQSFRKNGKKRYAPLLEHLAKKSYRYLDLLEPFKNASGDSGDTFVTYSAADNELVARAVQEYLISQNLDHFRRGDQGIGLKNLPVPSKSFPLSH